MFDDILGKEELSTDETTPNVEDWSRDVESAKGLINGDFMKGNYMAVKLRRVDASNLVNLGIVSVRYLDSPVTAK